MKTLSRMLATLCCRPLWSANSYAATCPQIVLVRQNNLPHAVQGASKMSSIVALIPAMDSVNHEVATTLIPALLFVRVGYALRIIVCFIVRELCSSREQVSFRYVCQAGSLILDSKNKKMETASEPLVCTSAFQRACAKAVVIDFLSSRGRELLPRAKSFAYCSVTSSAAREIPIISSSHFDTP